MKHFLAGAALAALVACAPKAEAPAAPAAPAVKLYALDCGRAVFADVDGFADDGSMKGVSQEFVDPCFLVRHPSGDLLWDTGFPEVLAAPGAPQPKGMTITFAKTIAGQLAELGLTPADIEFVSFSHMHLDHTGNGGLFAAASTWIVDADERVAMFDEKARKAEGFAAYAPLENAKTVLIEGDATHDVFGDGSVVIHQAPGHTPGHTVLLVKTAGAGAVLLTGDLWHLPQSRERRLVPRFNVDRAQTLASMDKVEALATETGARIIRQHVPEDYASLPAFPAALE